MIISTLARKVFDQTDIPQDLTWAWWVELKLQLMRINGLVKMINASKKIEKGYIDGYLPRYKWSFRPENERLKIGGFAWFYSLIQNLSEDFNWGDWSTIITISEDDVELISECIGASIAYSKPYMAYMLAIYKSQLQEIHQKHLEQIQAINNSVGGEFCRVVRSESTKLKWESLRNLI